MILILWDIDIIFLFQLLTGNTNTFTIVDQKLDPPVIASKVRFLPYSDHVRTVCMRVELLGCIWTGKLIWYNTYIFWFHLHKFLLIAQLSKLVLCRQTNTPGSTSRQHLISENLFQFIFDQSGKWTNTLIPHRVRDIEVSTTLLWDSFSMSKLTLTVVLKRLWRLTDSRIFLVTLILSIIEEYRKFNRKTYSIILILMLVLYHTQYARS